MKTMVPLKDIQLSTKLVTDPLSIVISCAHFDNPLSVANIIVNGENNVISAPAYDGIYVKVGDLSDYVTKYEYQLSIVNAVNYVQTIIITPDQLTGFARKSDIQPGGIYYNGILSDVNTMIYTKSEFESDKILYDDEISRLNSEINQLCAQLAAKAVPSEIPTQFVPISDYYELQAKVNDLSAKIDALSATEEDN